MIVIYTGRRGAGKTLTMIKDAINFYHDGWRIYSNMYSLNIPHTYISEEEMLGIDKHSGINDCVLIVDEIQLLLESRRSQKNTNVKFSHFIQQIRKRNIVMLCTTQFSGTVDVRLRQHIDVRVKPRIDVNLDVVFVIYEDLTSIEDEYGMQNSLRGMPDSVSMVFDARDVYGVYNTREML